MGFQEEETFNQRPEGADGGSRRTLGQNLPGRRKSKDKRLRGEVCLCQRLRAWSRGRRGDG